MPKPKRGTAARKVRSYLPCFDTGELGRHIKYDATPTCRGCPAKPQCTTNKGGRRSTRWGEEGLLEEMAHRVKNNPQMTKHRQQFCEHPFGTMKRALNSGTS